MTARDAAFLIAERPGRRIELSCVRTGGPTVRNIEHADLSRDMASVELTVDNPARSMALLRQAVVLYGAAQSGETSVVFSGTARDQSARARGSVSLNYIPNQSRRISTLVPAPVARQAAGATLAEPWHPPGRSFPSAEIDDDAKRHIAGIGFPDWWYGFNDATSLLLHCEIPDSTQYGYVRFGGDEYGMNTVFIPFSIRAGALTADIPIAVKISYSAALSRAINNGETGRVLSLIDLLQQAVLLGKSPDDASVRSGLTVMLPNESPWSSSRNTRLFDHISICANPGSSFVVKSALVVLNNITISIDSFGITNRVSPGNPFRLDVKIRHYRLTDHLGFSDTRFVPPVLEAAGMKIGQSWNATTGGKWPRMSDASPLLASLPCRLVF
ncbi:MAG: hypothetical protein M5R36_14235 [Deltaproteobacteria bacterium]|nr:hypothetical protein [Deltaproteobacteria bacterium]